MSENNEPNENFKNLSRLSEYARQQVLDDTTLAVDRVNQDTKRAIQAALEAQASQEIAQQIADAGRIVPRQRAQIIQKVHRNFRVHEFEGMD